MFTMLMCKTRLMRPLLGVAAAGLLLGTVYWSESSVHQTRDVGTTASHTTRIELKF